MDESPRKVEHANAPAASADPAADLARLIHRLRDITLENYIGTSDDAADAIERLLQEVIERAYGCLWRETGDAGLFVFRARKLLLSLLDKEGQKRGIAWALEQFGEPPAEQVMDALGPQPATLSLYAAMEIARNGFNAWAAKPHNAKWAKRIDGTPIPNDLVVCIAEAFATPLPAPPHEPTGEAP